MIRPILLSLLLAGPAAAHSWYDSDCCSDKDCAPVSPSAITIRSDGYLATLNPGDHPTVVRRTSRLIPFTDPDVRPSLDGEWHVCVAPFFTDYGDMGRMSGVQTGNSEPLCIYVPGAGA